MARWLTRWRWHGAHQAEQASCLHTSQPWPPRRPQACTLVSLLHPLQLVCGPLKVQGQEGTQHPTAWTITFPIPVAGPC